MSQLALRSPNPFVILCGLLFLGAAGAAVAQEGPRSTPRAVQDSRVRPPLQAKLCDSCAAAHQKCFATCFSGSKRRVSGCLSTCDKAALSCKCEGDATLRSDDLVKFGLVNITKDGCHATQLCPSGYSSCAGWSGPSVCGASYCQNESYCGDPWCDNGCDPDGGDASHTPYQQFRVCFDQFGNSCTEWVSFDAAFCGC